MTGRRERSRSFVVKKNLVDDDPSSRLEARKALLSQKAAFLRGPIVVDISVEMEIGWWKRIIPHIASVRADARLEAVAPYILIGNFTDGG